MTIALIAWAIGVGAVIGLALILPCEGCRLRRERLKRAYAQWRDTDSAKN